MFARRSDGSAPRLVTLEIRATGLGRRPQAPYLLGDRRAGPLQGELQSRRVVVPLRLHDSDGGEPAFFSALSTFGTAIDIPLPELAIGAFCPADAQIALRLLRAVDPGAGSGPRPGDAGAGGV